VKKAPIPQAVNFGPWIVYIYLVPQKIIRKKLRLKKGYFDGMWDNKLGEGKPTWYNQRTAGNIYIHKALPLKNQWRTLLHEMQHAVVDLLDWDWEN
jgi:hypothetical protein